VLAPWRRFGARLTGPVPVSVLLALVIGGLAIMVAGKNPITAYPSMFEGALTGRGLVNTVQRAVPIVGMAIALAIAFRAGVVNLGAEGQMVLGGLAGTLVALNMGGPGPLVVVSALIAAVLAGGLWGVLSAVLQTRLGVPILITSLLLNYPARYLSSYLVRFPLKESGSSMVATPAVADDVRIPALIPADSAMGQWMGRALGRDHVLVLLARGVNWSLLVVLVVVALTIFMVRRTPAGFESGMAGLNMRFARYAGVDTNRLAVRTMFVSGGISGLVGVMLVLGSQYRLIDGALAGTNYAWTGLLVALLAMSRPIGVLIAGTFFAAIIVGGEAMQRSAGVSGQISQLIQAAVIVLVAIRVRFGGRWRRRASTPPTASSTVAQS
jgi:simple sugar transport system permease protein